ncbi:MAG: succinate dehydrogenase cytochrome b subunit [Cyclobacteriaceae bacterium]|nr:succinate dehydrogenase cytochrome b subunit [Cyclobacteriaceae bacterium]MDH4296649.1 succinate dehydrogenase cytochrome b subunit [Cyclobacteriaceae bacterium]MDH5247658.1 succinate dehydrogenase cytochrome b subunit [Cyclobacteriaceae bacterium]
MNWFTSLLSSTLGRKLLMALTGLFLILFLIVHLIGNLQLLKHDGGEAFNVYAQFMTSNPLIKIVSYVNYILILLHIFWAIMLSRHNRAARGDERYAVNKNSSDWTSRNMGILGTFIFIFLVIHLKGFWYEMHWGGISVENYDGKEVKNLFAVVDRAYDQWWYVAIYTFSMLALAFHLWHGFASAFQTLGLNHVKYNPVIRFVGRTFAIVVPVLFALIPVWMFLT